MDEHEARAMHEALADAERERAEAARERAELARQEAERGRNWRVRQQHVHEAG